MLPRLILASTSSYRRTLLARLGLPFEATAPNVDETPRSGELAAELAVRLATAKAESAALPNCIVIGSDQVAALGKELLSKPGAHEVALRQLLACQGKPVTFHTAVVVLDSASGKRLHTVDRTRVHFSMLGEAELDRYLRAEQPYDCAGGFKAEGLGIALFERIESSDPTALVGLPLIWLSRTLRTLGLDPLGAWRDTPG
jgi:septum formation protein